MKPAFQWVAGRQNKPEGEPGYFKMKLAERHWPSWLSKRPANDRGGFDCYLLKYDPHFTLPPHTDKVPAHLRHYRLNVVLAGHGLFLAEKTICNLFGQAVLFRPDLYVHSMQNGPKTRLVLSLGIAV